MIIHSLPDISRLFYLLELARGQALNLTLGE